ncbi:phage tail protein [Caulobacter sp. S45]|uniref:phage tail protein n=1 Tax=Caulobacter sp. S45 TaxID=1641861 RepID=UPI00157621E8|nr:phage tail protein [Caulobacter sp. S45]
MGAKSTSTVANRYVGVQVQQSVKAAVIPRGWGTFRASCNLLDYQDFKSTAQSTSAGGKGGSGSTKSYTYSASVVLGVCSGVVAGVRTVWRDQSTYTDGSTTALAQAGLSLIPGAIGQAPWSYLQGAHADQAIGYSGLAYVCAANYALNSSATVANHAFEVQSAIRQAVGGQTLDDANPADIAFDLLAGVPQWPSSVLSDLTSYATYCLATGLLLSPFLDAQRSGADVLSDILTASNADCVWSGGVLKIIPYGDTPVSANGAEWAPDLDPLYDLTDDDFLAQPNADPVQRDVKRGADAYNSVEVEFLDRAQAYASDIAPARDQANIDAYGLCRQDPVSLHCICDAGVAGHVAQLLVQRACHVRRTYSFQLDERYGLLDPMDLVTLTSGRLDRVLVRLTQVKEEGDGAISCVAEEMLVGAAHAALYTRQSAGGYVSNFAADPGPVSVPVLINPPVGYVAQTVASVRASTGGVSAASIGYEAWAAVAGVGANWGGCEVWASFDDLSYQKVGEVQGRARYGVSTADFPAGSDPDATNALQIDLSASLAELDPATQADADGGATLSVIGGEMIAWRDAILTGPNAYTLGGYIRRGLYGTPITDHPAGSEFARIDADVFRYAYDALQAGKTLYLKFPSFNLYGEALQGLDEAVAYQMPLTPNTTSSVIEVQAQSIVGQGALATLDTADTPQIAPNAITYGATLDANPTVTLNKGAAYVQVGELVYQPSGGRLKLDVLVVLGNPNDGDAGVLLSVRRGGVEIDNFPLIARETFDTPWTPFTFDDDVPAGVDADYTLWAQIPSAPGADSCTVGRVRIAVEEFKR